MFNRFIGSSNLKFKFAFRSQTTDILPQRNLTADTTELTADNDQITADQTRKL